MNDKLVCDVCHENEAIGVASSSLGPISFAYCRRCATEGAEPFWMLATTISMCGGYEHTANWVASIVEATLRITGKTREELDAAVAKNLEELDHMHDDDGAS